MATPADPSDPEFLVDFADNEIDKIRREQQMCVECFLYKHVELFRSMSNVCLDCEDE